MNQTYLKIKQAGGRLTKVRKAVVDALLETKCFLSKANLEEILAGKKIKPNRSTIYRELRYLSKNNIVQKSSIGGADYYEIPKDHHHHLVCIGCDAIEEVAMKNHLQKCEKQLAKRKNFEITHHSLEFFGYCKKCRAGKRSES